ncbi:MAG: hypothetical protein J7604_08510 [Sporocytophaga sp.]|uniref:hypothetical protein n=1 Tax=Sporocytophaga sp. TaxID=2231183 RepID=UPI001B20B26C|nr:hypothetical protein [Sporocytophaga sp.]MBO9700238.1 hypothetical protein [Sporocytophaga sp.]
MGDSSTFESVYSRRNFVFLEEVEKRAVQNLNLSSQKIEMMKLKVFWGLAFLWIPFQLSAQTSGNSDTTALNSEYKPGRIVTARDTIDCFVIDKDNSYYFNGNIKYKLKVDDSGSLKIKSKDIIHLELEGNDPFDRLPYGPLSYLMVKLVDGDVKLYETAIDGFDDYGTYTNGGMNTTYNPNLDRYFLVRESLIIKVSRRMSSADIKKIFPDNNEFLKQFEKMDYQQFLKNIKQLIINYNTSIKKKADENQ